ncbi:conserved hypothetical protein [Neospora caninum Liverpool]|uniref:Alpha-tubulin N-acetyltransferase n=1 Tax=Neospora caninum (strain Liverpool) TaxID=572307 RepID=F0VA98_NEOCL|nr:conserved hypothetical protein [Neospora caninum Liverpool]CBZ50587.1 conserved hypothetical protein [Neospora caninum Liverpool]CEL65200.1 TPA: Alpha-tubulin N-acetyltransferase [Neospora caninum Liverpool]|eukprot:XP_003880620.1 conserved hypothetical protein [Neospora caninum Liverpool]
MEVPFAFLHCRVCAPPSPSQKKGSEEDDACVSASFSSAEPLQKLALHSCAATFIFDRSLLPQIGAYAVKHRPPRLSSSSTASRPPTPRGTCVGDPLRRSSVSCRPASSSLPPVPAGYAASLSAWQNAFCPRAFAFIEPIAASDSSASPHVSSSAADSAGVAQGAKAVGFWVQTGSQSFDLLQFLRGKVDSLGEKSAAAQGIQFAMTSLAKLEAGSLKPAPFGPPRKGDVEVDSAVRLYMRIDRGFLRGFLKIGNKILWVGTNSGMERINALSLLDFYILESCQREGHGRRLFERMLATERLQAGQIAYDRPSSKMLSFLKKFFALREYIPQANNFVVFNVYFEEKRKESAKEGESGFAGRKAGPVHTSAVHVMPRVAETEGRIPFEANSERSRLSRPFLHSGARVKTLQIPSAPAGSTSSASSLMFVPSETAASRPQAPLAKHTNRQERRQSGQSRVPEPPSRAGSLTRLREAVSSKSSSDFSPILSSTNAELKGMSREESFHRLLPTLQSRSSAFGGSEGDKRDRTDTRLRCLSRDSPAGLPSHARLARRATRSLPQELVEREGGSWATSTESDETLLSGAKGARAHVRREGDRGHEAPRDSQEKRDADRREDQRKEGNPYFSISVDPSCSTRAEEERRGAALKEKTSHMETGNGGSSFRAPECVSSALKRPTYARSPRKRDFCVASYTSHTSDSSRKHAPPSDPRQDRDGMVGKADASFPTYPFDPAVWPDSERSAVASAPRDTPGVGVGLSEAERSSTAVAREKREPEPKSEVSRGHGSEERGRWRETEKRKDARLARGGAHLRSVQVASLLQWT